MAAEAPAVNARATCSGVPAPPEAMTGRCTASATAFVISRSYPACVPSWSMLLTTISPAPSSSPRRAHSSASMPVATRAPSLGAGGDVVEDDLVDALGVHQPGDLGRVPDVHVVLEPARLGDPPALDVEAGDDTGGQHAGT